MCELHHRIREATDLGEAYKVINALGTTSKLFETTAGTYSAAPRGRLYSAMLLSFHGGGREDEEVFK